MTALPKPAGQPQAESPGLRSGDLMTREEFHHVYEQMPEDFKAELGGGIFYLASPLRVRHGNRHLLLGGLLAAYEGAKPGVEAADNATILLGDAGEPQPDLCLRILPEHGGQSGTTEDDYIEGAPELLAGEFPGLWIDTVALVAKEHRRAMNTLQQGLTSPGHAAFVERLARAKK